MLSKRLTVFLIHPVEWYEKPLYITPRGILMVVKVKGMNLKKIR